MSERDDAALIGDIREAIRRIGQYTERTTQDDFIKDKKTQDAVVRNLEIIGEAVKHVSSRLKQKEKGIPWKEMAGVRDRLIHHYFGVNLDVVWAIIRNELPKVISHLDRILPPE